LQEQVRIKLNADQENKGLTCRDCRLYVQDGFDAYCLRSAPPLRIKDPDTICPNFRPWGKRWVR